MDRTKAKDFWSRTVFDATGSDSGYVISNMETSEIVDKDISIIMQHINAINNIRNTNYDWAKIMNLDNKKLWKGKVVMDFGCGTGCVSYLISKNKPKHITVTDIVSTNVSVADKVLNFAQQEHSIVVWDTIECLDMCLKSLHLKYDIIYSDGVIHHIPDAKEVVNVLKKYLKPHGYFHLMLYSGRLKDLYQHGSIKDDDKITTVCEGPYARTYTKEEVEELFGPEFEVWDEIVFNNGHFCLWIIGRK